MIGRKETPLAVHTSWYLLIFVLYAGRELDSSQEDDEEGVK